MGYGSRFADARVAMTVLADALDRLAAVSERLGEGGLLGECEGDAAELVELAVNAVSTASAAAEEAYRLAAGQGAWIATRGGKR